jgi:hypothetical protein
MKLAAILEQKPHDHKAASDVGIRRPRNAEGETADEAFG